MASPAARFTILVPLIGATLVWYDFHLFGALATTISPSFFNKGTPALMSAAYLSTFAFGLVARPAGALLFGRVGDTSGRKYALSHTLLLTGVATLLMGLLPTYRAAGVAAPVALLVLRALQGLALGGLYASAVIYCAEHAPEHRRGFNTSWIQMAPVLGLLLSLVLVGVVGNALGRERFALYGWRMTFLPSLVLVGLALYVRRMEEPQAPAELEQGGAGSKRSALLGGGNVKPLLAALFVAAGQAAVWYVAQFYAAFHLQNVLKVNAFAAACMVAAALLLGLPFFVLFGSLSDRVGRKKVIVAGCLMAAVLYIPTYAGMQRAAGTNVVAISAARNSVTGAHGPTPLALDGGALKPAAESSNPNLVALTALLLVQTVILAMVSGPLGAYFAEAFKRDVRCTSTALSYSVAHGVVGSLLPFFSLPLLATSGDIYAGLYYAVAVAFVSFLVGVFAVRGTAGSVPGV